RCCHTDTNNHKPSHQTPKGPDVKNSYIKMLASTIQLPQQHPTNTNHQSTTLRPIPAGQTFTLEHHHNTQLRCPWLFQNPTVCQNLHAHDHAQHQPPQTNHP